MGVIYKRVSSAEQGAFWQQACGKDDKDSTPIELFIVYVKHLESSCQFENLPIIAHGSIDDCMKKLNEIEGSESVAAHMFKVDEAADPLLVNDVIASKRVNHHAISNICTGMAQHDCEFNMGMY